MVSEKNLIGKAKEFFATRRAGFYFTLAVAVISFVQLIVYAVAFSSSAIVTYRHWTVIFFAALAALVAAAMPFFRVTAPWAAAAATLAEFLSFLMFVYHGYMYFSQIFYGGVSVSLFFQMHYGYLASMILYVLALAAGTAAVFLRGEKRREPDASRAAEETCVPAGSTEEAPAAGSTEEAPAAVSDAPLCYAEAYAILPADAKARADAVLAYAKSRAGAEEKTTKRECAVRVRGKAALRLRVRRGVPEVHFDMESDELRTYRKEADIAIPHKDTVVRLTDEASVAAACRMADIAFGRLEREREAALMRRREKKARKGGNENE